MDKTDAVVPQGKILVFNPNIVHRIWIWLDVAIVCFFYTFLISLVEFLVCYTTCSWYFTRKKESAYVFPKYLFNPLVQAVVDIQGCFQVPHGYCGEDNPLQVLFDYTQNGDRAVAHTPQKVKTGVKLGKIFDLYHPTFPALAQQGAQVHI